jgi:pyridoxal phosphate enzyme (YggS family)
LSDHPTAVSNPDDAGLAERLATVQRRIASACESAGRSPGSVTLVAVTKYAEPGQVSALVRLGVTDLGENYVQNLQKRTEAVGPPSDSLRWHFVGHLQRNKVKQVLPHVTMLQTLDSLRLAEELESQVPRVLGPTARLPVLMQVNCSEEPQKSGVAVGAARHLGSEIASMKHLRLMGLMTMAKEGDDEAGTRRTFTRCREIFEEMRRHGVAGEDLRHLSMGMTTDLEHGIAEGATIVRVGSALFKNPEA